ncbi:flagellin C [Rhizobium sp. R72]|uniref:flagellin N-terminal helical domain-containing protein n=1 Tax=unclassified Rhizobium TaxID=2613769 RepID=UPI000B537DA1|nr:MULTISPECIES: flagellin [unclassified Rhizobium]OWV98183.1 flagellin C [Rhizobium sp. R693]OWW03341.1 flagellin C [Rhizobium sp. R72]OWW03533.1 flagellin C [Rhizobium sp. R711]
MSIYRRTSVDAALYVLRDIGRDMTKTQRQVSTGLRVEKASDNGAYWAISSTLKTDQKAQSAIGDALGLAAATMGTAYNAVDSAIDLVSEIKAKLVAATESGVDKDKINTDITQLKDQLRSVAQSAEFNGDNWVAIDDSADPSKPRQIPSSFIRYPDGTVKVDMLSYEADLAPVGATTSQDARYLIDDRTTGSGEYGALTSQYFATEAGASQNYVMLKGAGNTAGQVEIGVSSTTTQAQVTEMITVVDRMLNQMTTVGSAFGALEKRISIQSDFAQSLDDSYSRGISRLIDADMEEQSSRLRALQTQEQLGLQSLNIANASYDKVRQLFQNF